MLEELTAVEYHDFERLYRDSPWGPWIDGYRMAFIHRFLGKFPKGTKISDLVSPWGSGGDQTTGEDIEAIIETVNYIHGVTDDMAEFMKAETKRMKEKQNA